MSSVVRLFRCILLVALVAATHVEAQAGGEALPNVIVIMVDDLGFGDLGAFGGEHADTPRLDAFASEGVRLTRMYSSPVCSPTRARLLTGRSPQRFGLRRQLNEAVSDRGLPSQAFTIAEMFADVGYQTAHYGKWHLGRNSKEHLPFSHGFGDGAFRLDFLYNDPTFQAADGTIETQSGHSTEVMTDYAIDYVETQSESQPFFLSLWYWAPHRSSAEPDESTAYFPPTEWAELYEDTESGRRSAQIAHLDHELGRLFDRLVELGIDRRTLIIFASDNGAVDLGAGDIPNGELKGFKGELFEGGIRVPAMMRWPGKIQPDTTYDNLLIIEDFFPTLGEALDYDLSNNGLDGRSFYPALQGTMPPLRPDRLFWEYRPGGARADEPGDLLNNYAVRSRRWKLVVSADADDRSLISEVLYDVLGDPNEETDLSQRNPEIVDELKHHYSQWRRESLDVPYATEDLRGQVEEIERTFTFSGPGQALIERNTIFNISDGDFTFTAVVEIDAAAFDGVTSEIAYKKDSWRLIINPAGHLQLEVDGSEGQFVRLESPAPLPSGVPMRLSFTVATWKNHPTLFRLYVDDLLEAQESQAVIVRSSPAVIRLGSRGAGLDKPFYGVIDQPRFYVSTLLEDELAALGTL